MANFEGTTASNGAKIKQGSKQAIMEIINKYNFCELTVGVVGVDDQYMQIYGYDWFDAQLIGYDDEENTDFASEFLAELAPFLAEPLIIQCIGAEKCRFPLSAMEIKVNPDGLIEWNQFKYN